MLVTCMLLVMGFIGLPALGLASKGLPEGAAPMGMDLSCSERTDSLDVWSLAVWTWGERTGVSGKAEAKIHVGAGAVVIEGDTLCSVAASSGFWRLKLKKLGEGPVQIIGSLRISDPKTGIQYYSEDELEASFEGDSVLVRNKRPLERIRIEGGRRYRYGGQYLVALDSGESGSVPVMEAGPQLLGSPDVTCTGCGLTGPIFVEAVVTVGRNGSATWVRPAPVQEYQFDPRVWAAVQDEIRKYAFMPARSKSGPASDNAVLRIRVTPGQTVK